MPPRPSADNRDGTTPTRSGRSAPVAPRSRGRQRPSAAIPTTISASGGHLVTFRARLGRGLRLDPERRFRLWSALTCAVRASLSLGQLRHKRINRLRRAEAVPDTGGLELRADGHRPSAPNAARRATRAGTNALKAPSILSLNSAKALAVHARSPLRDAGFVVRENPDGPSMYVHPSGLRVRLHPTRILGGDSCRMRTSCWAATSWKTLG